MSTEAEKFAPTGRRGDPGASGPGLALAQSGEDDDTDHAYYDTPSGNIWRPPPSPGSLRRRARAAGLPARSPAAKRRPACDRPGRGASSLR
jgi:hypothetical protein